MRGVQYVKILFVCTGNSFRSAVAEALMKKVRSDIEVESAGTHPAGMIAPNARRLLEKENASVYLKSVPEWVGEKNLKEFDLIVGMKENHRNEILRQHPEVAKKMEVWDVDDPINLPLGADEKVFDEIKAKVAMLAASTSH